ncbi:hypothetical protein BGX31_007957 [Mortierella sp. GBA43]|nr:hypothetical protein BGX31_007957 [Mortierella sp. GBA43]
MTESINSAQLSANVRGMFASSSRLLACFVNEGLMQATYLPNISAAPMDGHGPVALLTLQDISIVVSLAHTPQIDEHGAILFLDRLDLQYPILVGTTLAASKLPIYLTECCSPSSLMRLVAARMDSIDEALLNQTYDELDSSVEHMSYLFLHPRPEPTLNSTAIEWEQSLIEGQGAHPMHKSRYAVPPTCRIEPDTDLYNIELVLASMPADSVVVSGDFLTIMDKLLPADMVPIGRVPIFVHPLQVPTVVSKVPEATIHPFTVPVHVQSSLRTVNIPDLPNYAFKIPLGITVTSCMRTMSLWSPFMGPRLTPVLDRIIPKSNVLRFALEHSSVAMKDTDNAIACHLACIIRNDFSAALREQGEAVVVAAALADIFIDLALEAFLVPLLEYGFVFEAHQQNTLIRFKIPQSGDNSPVYPIGLIMRDSDGIRVHQETLFKSTGMRVQALPGNPHEVTELSKAYARLYHTLIQMHLHRLIRALDLHYSGEGWSILRTKLEHYLKPGDIGHEQWLSSETCQWKCFVRMKMVGAYYESTYRDVPNTLLYTGEGRVMNSNQ